jgi:hypothetical protein
MTLGTSGAWATGQRRSPTDRHGQTYLRVHLAEPSGPGAPTRAFLISHGSGRLRRLLGLSLTLRPYCGTAIAVWIGSFGASLLAPGAYSRSQRAWHTLPRALARIEGGWLSWAAEAIFPVIGRGLGRTGIPDHSRSPGLLALRSRATYFEGGVLSCGDRAFSPCWCCAPSPSW